ncbi:hypothetical protein [Legionella nagasakiensis]|nr:hypothetical protein [Legionella nagasakiensis]
MTREIVIDVHKLRKSFDDRVVVNDVDLQVKKGKSEFYCQCVWT